MTATKTTTTRMGRMNSSAASADHLRAEIERRRAVIEECDEEVGAALLDGRNTTKAKQRAQEAHEEMEELQAALVVLERRAAEDAERAEREAAATARAEAYEWTAEYARCALAVLEADAAAAAAHDRLVACAKEPPSRRVWLAKRNVPHDAANTSDLDADLTQRVPDRLIKRDHLVRRFNADALRELIADAEQHAEAERNGEGVDYTGDQDAKAQRHAAERQAARAERRAKQDARWRELTAKREAEAEAEQRAGTRRRSVIFT